MPTGALSPSYSRARLQAIAVIKMKDPAIHYSPIKSMRKGVDVIAMAREPRNPGGGDGTGAAVITKTRPATKRPKLYRVLLLNDDYTPMEFVIEVLERFFNKDRDGATHIMLHVHHNGVGECGVYTYEVAETKVTQVMDFARKNQHPLQCVMEEK